MKGPPEEGVALEENFRAFAPAVPPARGSSPMLSPPTVQGVALKVCLHHLAQDASPLVRFPSQHLPAPDPPLLFVSLCLLPRRSPLIVYGLQSDCRIRPPLRSQGPRRTVLASETNVPACPSTTASARPSTCRPLAAALSWLSRLPQLGASLGRRLFEILLSTLMGFYPEEELLDPTVIVFLSV